MRSRLILAAEGFGGQGERGQTRTDKKNSQANTRRKNRSHSKKSQSTPHVTNEAHRFIQEAERNRNTPCVTALPRASEHTLPHDEHEELLRRLQCTGIEGLSELEEDSDMHPSNISMHFLCWLAARESAANGREQAKLGALAAGIVAVREGLRPVSLALYSAAAADLAKYASMWPSPNVNDMSASKADDPPCQHQSVYQRSETQQAAADSLEKTRDEHTSSELDARFHAATFGDTPRSFVSGESAAGSSDITPGHQSLELQDTLSAISNGGRESPQRQQEALRKLLGPSSEGLTDAQTIEIAARRAALALSPQGTELAARQVSQLQRGVLRSRAESALQLLGRSRAGPDTEAAMSAATAADQILSYLLTVEDDEERAGMLPDAFTVESPALQSLTSPPAGSREGVPFDSTRPGQEPLSEDMRPDPTERGAVTGGTALGGANTGRSLAGAGLTKRQRRVAAAAAAGLRKLAAADARLHALGTAADSDAEEVQLSTTPLRLLNALDARFNSLQQDFDAQLAGIDDEESSTKQFMSHRQRLKRLRIDVLQFIDL